MFNRINYYIFFHLLKSCCLIFFIFLSVSWLLQITRLFGLTNLVQIDVLNIIYLSVFLIPNLITVIIPFIIIFGILLCFIKLNKDKELIAIYSLGLEIQPIKYSIFIFTLLLIMFYSLLNFYISPKIYEQYKQNEFELRNKIDLNRVVTTNFLKINDKTTVDFKNKGKFFEDIFINFKDESENIIFAKKGKIKNDNNFIIFQLIDGFKLSINKNNNIEKLEFANYLFKIKNENSLEFYNYDRNSFTIFDDIENKNYLNISYKTIDIILTILIIFIFYKNNIINVKFDLKNNLIFIFYSVLILITNQLLKNSEVNLSIYLSAVSFIIFLCLILLLLFKEKYE